MGPRVVRNAVVCVSVRDGKSKSKSAAVSAANAASPPEQEMLAI